MTEEKRQRVLLAVLAVSVLGPGGVWVALHDWSGSGSTGVTRSSAERKIREPAKQEETKRSSREKRDRVAENTRQERKTVQRDDPGRKTRRNRRGNTKTEKKSIVPVS